MPGQARRVPRLVLINGLRPETSADLYADVAEQLGAQGIDVVLVNAACDRLPDVRLSDLVVSNVALPPEFLHHGALYTGRSVPRPESMQWIASAGIPTMDWTLARTRREVRRLFAQWSVDRLILKPSFTGGGRGVRAFSRGALWRIRWHAERDIFCREVNAEDGTVYKAELFNGRLMIAWMSRARPLRDHFTRGVYRDLRGAYGERERIDLPASLCDRLCALSHRLMALGLGYVSVDLMRRPDGELVAIELNTRDVAKWWTRQFPEFRERYVGALAELVRTHCCTGVRTRPNHQYRHVGPAQLSAMTGLFKLFDFVLYAIHPVMVYRFVRELGQLPRITLPRTYNEKMLWRMVFDRNPQFVTYSDKLGSKACFARICPDLRVPGVLWQGDAPEGMPFRFLSEPVAIKASHGCHFNWFPDHMPPDQEAFQREARRWLAADYSRQLGEWAYREVRPRLFVEEWVEATPPSEIIELKVHVFHGAVFYTVVYLREKSSRSLSAIFDAAGSRLTVTNSVVAGDPGRALPEDFRLPACYRQAMDAASRVAAQTDYLRVDFMVADDVLFGGEITVYPAAGLMTNSSPECMDALARAWDLRLSWLLSTPQKGWRRHYVRWLRRALDGLSSPGAGLGPMEVC